MFYFEQGRLAGRGNDNFIKDERTKRWNFQGLFHFVMCAYEDMLKAVVAFQVSIGLFYARLLQYIKNVYTDKVQNY